MIDDLGSRSSDPAAIAPESPVPEADDASRREIEAALQRDETALGDIWRRTAAGESNDEIRIARGAKETNFLWNYRRITRAFLGDIPTTGTAPTVSQAAARSLKSFLKRNTFSPATRELLDQRLELLEANASSPVGLAVEERHAREATVMAEAKDEPGVYVYALPHYIRYPYAENGRTLFKVGSTGRDSIRRFREQTRTTALPEDPVLLRVYHCTPDDSIEKETSFHRLLEAAGHDRSAGRTGGREWFITSVPFLDAIAETLGLQISVVAELADYGASPGA